MFAAKNTFFSSGGGIVPPSSVTYLVVAGAGGVPGTAAGRRGNLLADSARLADRNCLRGDHHTGARPGQAAAARRVIWSYLSPDRSEGP